MNNYMKTIISGLKQWVSSQKSDWNQNDSSAVNYVKNRPFFEESVARQLFNEELFTYTMGWYFGSDDAPISLSSDLAYKVVWDGVSYECIPKFDGIDNYFLGNTKLLGDPEASENNEPFCISWYELNNGISVSAKECLANHTFSLYSLIDGVETVIIEDEYCDGEAEFAWADWFDDLLEITEAGKEYIITIDGESFNCVSKFNSENDYYYLGNCIWVEDTGEPFYVEIYPWTDDDGKLHFGGDIGLKYMGMHKVAISGTDTVVHKLDEKFIPDTIARVDDIVAQGAQIQIIKWEADD